MEVSLRLTRANALDNEFDFDKHIPHHCPGAAYCLFVLDTLEVCQNTETWDLAVKKKARKNARKAVLSSLPCTSEKLQGGVHCTMRVAAFTAMLKLLPSQSSRTAKAALEWAQEAGLRGNTRETEWDINDLMFSLETLAVHWESLVQTQWSTSDFESAVRFFQDQTSPLSGYLLYLWRQCARFVFMKDSREIAAHMNAGIFTLPYNCGDGSRKTALHTHTVTTMCEIWRYIYHERSMSFCLSSLRDFVFCQDDEREFLDLFNFETRQLDVDKFREMFRKRLAARFLCPADAEIFRQLKGGGKKFDPDSVINERHALNLPGFLQEVGAGWDFDRISSQPMVRDELFRAMSDSGCLSKCGADFSTRFFEEPGVPVNAVPRNKRIPYVKRYGHAFVLMFNSKAVTPPVPFATAFASWARKIQQLRLKPYGINYGKVTTTFA